MLDLFAIACLHPLRTLAVLGVVLAFGLVRRRTRSGRLALRSALVGVTLLALFMLSVLGCSGAPRRALVARVKHDQADQGRLVQSARWGVVDWNHVATTREHVEQARRHLADPATRAAPLRLIAEGASLSGPWSTTHTYQLRQPELLQEAQIEDAARAVALQAAFDLEVEQERAPWSSGLALTAWQYEDLPSALFAVGAEPNELTSGLFTLEGDAFRGVEMRSYRLPAALRSAEREQTLRALHAASWWSAPSSLPLRWEPIPSGQAS